MKPALVDVNVLVALFDPAHLHHDVAHNWFASIGKRRWASCPLSRAGALRVLARLSSGMPISQVAERLLELFAHPNHQLLHTQPDILDATRFDVTRLQGPNQITDALLLATAIHHKAALLTVDRSIPWRCVKGATSADVELI